MHYQDAMGQCVICAVHDDAPRRSSFTILATVPQEQFESLRSLAAAYNAFAGEDVLFVESIPANHRPGVYTLPSLTHDPWAVVHQTHTMRE